MSLAADNHNREAAKADMLFREGENHWDSDYVSSATQEKPELVINFTDTLVGRVVNSIADLDTRGAVLTRSRMGRMKNRLMSDQWLRPSRRVPLRCPCGLR